jgi:hypothetical protein
MGGAERHGNLLERELEIGSGRDSKTRGGAA